MLTLESLQKEIEAIKARNARVEADKAWETSWARRVVLLVLTYSVVVIVLLTAGLQRPFTNAIIPSVAFFISTLTVSALKAFWLRRRERSPKA